MKVAVLLATLSTGLLGVFASAEGLGYAGGQYRYWAFSNHNDLRDVLVYWVPGPFHVQLEYWDFVNPDTNDRFRPELGVHLKDARRSVYTLQWRHEGRQQRFWVMTDQVLAGGFVGRVEVSPIVASHSTEWVWGVGADYYWGSFHFAQATAIRDPRGDLWVVPIRVRLATETNDWVQLTVAPASQRTIGWAVEGKRGWIRAGVERNNRYDFTDLDNVIYTFGLEIPLQKTK